MAFYLFKLVREKIRENEAKKAIPTTDESNLAPEVTGHHHQKLDSNDHTQDGAELEALARHRDDSVDEERVARKEEEARKRAARQWNLMLGLALPNFLASVDVTIVAPAIPLISSHFHQLSGSFNWIVAAYTLTFTTFVPASGQLADIYGRHFALQFQMFWIMVGSVFCAAAHTWGMLLFGRALQGLGAAGIMSLSRIILSDGATLAENSRNNSILSIISGVSYGVGPVIGGYLADASWRYLFVLPVGVSVLSIALIYLLMSGELVRGRATSTESRRMGYMSGLRIIDWPGLATFILGVGCIILAIQWGGTSYSWNSAAIIAPLIIGAVLCIAFFMYEYLLGPGRYVARLFPNQVPMIPSTLFRKKDTALLMIINFSAGISLVSAFYFISYYWQLAEGYSPSKAGVQLLYYTPGLGIGVYMAMKLCNHWPRQTFFPLLWGSVVEAIGLSLLTYSVSIRHQTLVKVFLAVSGAGTGLRFMPVVLHAAGTWSKRISSIQSLLSFMLPLGETIGISMMGAVFSNKFGLSLSAISRNSPGLGLSASGLPSFDDLNALPADAKLDVQEAAARAVMWALIAVLPFIGLSIIASALLGNVWIGKTGTEAEDGKPGIEAEKGKVMYGAYLPALFKGTVADKKQELEVNHGHEDEAKRERVDDVELAEGGLVRTPQTAHVHGRNVYV